ncbi:MAG: hypothetical protein GY906_23560 [bacterium]|nr:hypothetical protein [bacterium]
MVIVASKRIFGGGPYSVVGSNQMRTVGSKKWPVAEISIGNAGNVVRRRNGTMMRTGVENCMPKSIRDAYHPGGNSACFMVQTAHLMGCNPIYMLGFTMQSGTGYFFGLENPATRKRSFYSDPERALSWLSWYQSQHPGRLKLWPGWAGPIYETLEVLDEEEAKRLAERESGSRHEQEPDGRDDEARERLQLNRPNRPVHSDVVQPVQRQQTRRPKAKPRPKPKKGRLI